MRRGIAFDVNGLSDFARGFFDAGDEGGIVFGVLQRRHEHAQPAFARLDGQRRAYGSCGDLGAR